jgi:zinc/manganese transport system substrate-binding protein
MRLFCTLWVLGWLPWAAPARLNVVATTPDFGAIARQIGGDQIEVVTLAKPTEDPHFVDPKPSFIVRLNRADALIEGGAELEAWLGPLLAGARNAKIAPGMPGRISCAKGIAMLEVPATLDRSQGDLHASGNPHYTTDPLNGRIVAATITEAFCQLAPQSASYFRANLGRFSRDLAARTDEWRKLLQPWQGKRVVTYHNYWPYFARCFGLTMDIFLEPKPGIPPSPSHLAEVVSRMKADQTKVILVQPYVSRKSAQTVAGLTGARIVDVAAFPGGGKASESYLEWMDSLVRALAEAFAEKK